MTTELRRWQLLDIWMALGGHSSGFEDWMDERTLVDGWAQLMAAIRGDITTLLEDSNPPAGALTGLVPIPVGDS